MEGLVVGAGAMGRWVGELLTEHAVPAHLQSSAAGADCRLSFYDEDHATAEQAAAVTGGRAVETPERSYDIVCIAVPIPAAETAIEAHAPRADAAVVDVTGTMAEPVQALAQAAPECERASFHPLFSPANEPGNVPVVIDEDGPTVSHLQDCLTDRGNHVYETTPTEHDEAMAVVQSKAHAAILSYALASEPVPEKFQTTVSRRLAELVEEVTSGEARVYADIQQAFDGAEDVADSAARLAAADRKTFEELYDSIWQPRNEE